MRPIFWGIIIFIVGLIGWVISIVFNVVTLGAFRWVSNMLLIVAIASLLGSIVLELINKNKKWPR